MDVFIKNMASTEKVKPESTLDIVLNLFDNAKKFIDKEITEPTEMTGRKPLYMTGLNLIEAAMSTNLLQGVGKTEEPTQEQEEPTPTQEQEETEKQKNSRLRRIAVRTVLGEQGERVYFCHNIMLERLYRDLYILPATSVEDQCSNLIITLLGKSIANVDSGTPILTKFYETVFLPQLGLTREQVLAGNILVSTAREILGDTKVSTKLEEKEYFDSSDFLDWEKDRPLYEKYLLITHREYSRFSQLHITKENLKFILNTLDRFSEYLAFGFSDEEREAILAALRSLPELKPASLKEVKKIFKTLFAKYSPNSGDDFMGSLIEVIGGVKTDLDAEYWRTVIE